MPQKSPLGPPYLKHAGTPGRRRDIITGRDRRRDSRCKSVFVPTLRNSYVIVLFINSNSNIKRHVLLSFIETARISASSDSPKKNLVLEIWLSVVPASTTPQRRPGLDCGNCSLDDGLTY